MSSIETLPAPELSPQQVDKWRREQRAFHDLLPGLLRDYPGQFVTIHDGRVVEAGEDKLAVAHRAYERFGYIPILVRKVAAVPDPPVCVPSPRQLDGPDA